MNGSELIQHVWHAPTAAAAGARVLLLPASGLFRLASRAYHGAYDLGVREAARAPIAVVSVGNLRVGGAGKTPFTGWVVDRLLELGRKPAVLHGGYGADEPELHRRWHPDVPVLVGRDRAASARRAAEDGRDVVVLDDGFQHRRLERDLDIVLLAAEHGTRPLRMLPRGPWREPLSALSRADVVVVTRKTAGREDAEAVARSLPEHGFGPAAIAWLRPAGWSTLSGGASEAPTGPAIGVAGLAEPQRFFESARLAGAELAGALVFPDHHEYTDLDVDRVLGAAAGRPVVTSAKDAVKLARLDIDADVRVLDLVVEIERGVDELMERMAQVSG